METGHKGIIAHLQRKDVIEVPDDAVTFFDDCASACPEDLSPCCGPGSRTYAENTTRSRQKHDYLVSSSFPSTSKDLVPPLSDSSVSKTFSSTQARYSTQTYIRPHISDVESIASVSANAKGTVIATANLETAVATIVRRSDSTMAEASTPAVVGAPMATEIVPDATTLMSSTTGSIQTTTAAGPDRPKESNAETHGMPPMSIAVLVIAGIVLVAVSLLGLGCWMKRRRRPPSVHEMVEVEEELDELHELGQQHTKSRTYRSVSRNTNRTSRTFPSRSASRATSASHSTTSSTSSRPLQSISRTTTLVESTAANKNGPN
ncbi:Regulator of nonsense transcripts 2 [Venturia inaequalis]|nr:Regulator of nonsense transcripts 2 [Venturia inaequalis]